MMSGPKSNNPSERAKSQQIKAACNILSCFAVHSGYKISRFTSAGQPDIYVVVDPAWKELLRARLNDESSPDPAGGGA